MLIRISGADYLIQGDSNGLQLSPISDNSRSGNSLWSATSSARSEEAGARFAAAAARFHIARGVDVRGRPTNVRLYHGELREIMDPIIDTLVSEISNVLRDTPPIAAAEVIEDGIWLTGGGACMPGMSERIAEFTSLKARLVPDPMNAVVNGAAQILSAAVFA